MVIPALDRCAALIAELAGGTVRPGVVDVHPRPHRAPEVRLRWHRPAELLGIDVSRDDARRILVGLGFEERASDAEGATFAVPSWRVDVSLEEDLVEEIVRTKGYDAIPETLPRERRPHARRAAGRAGDRPRPRSARGGWLRGGGELQLRRGARSRAARTRSRAQRRSAPSRSRTRSARTWR